MPAVGWNDSTVSLCGVVDNFGDQLKIMFDAFTDHGLFSLGGRKEIVSAGGDTTGQQEALLTVVSLGLLSVLSFWKTSAIRQKWPIRRSAIFRTKNGAEGQN